MRERRSRGERVDVIANVRIGGEGRELMPLALVDEAAAYDVHLAGGRIVDIAPAGAADRPGVVLDAEGGWLVPGLWDHHVHALPWALEAQRVPLGEIASATEAARVMGRAAPSDDGIRVGSGMRDALWPDAPERELLDRNTGETPTYLLNADLHSAWLNSAALRREGFASDDGLVREEAAFELIRRLSAVEDRVADRAIAAMADRAAARGVVGLIDMHMEWGGDDWRRRAQGGFDRLRVDLAVYTHRLEQVITEGLAAGDALDGAGDLVRMGPYKVISDGSLGTRTAACSHPYDADAPAEARGHLNVAPDALVAHMTRAAGAGFASAVHAIGDVAVAHALDAFAASGATGSVEHAQLVRHADVARFARLGVTASIQPTHAVEDRDLADALWASQTSLPYAWHTLDAAGTNLAFGSDAPVSALDPWVQIAAAVFRRDDDRDAWRPAEALDPATALAASTRGGSRGGARILPGEPADLAIVGADPLRAGEEVLRRMEVTATLLEGRLTHVA